MSAGRLVSRAYQPSAAASASRVAWSRVQANVGLPVSSVAIVVCRWATIRRRRGVAGRVLLAGAGEVHGVFADPVGAPVEQSCVFVAFGDVVDERGLGLVE